jgi:hypothetical protein
MDTTSIEASIERYVIACTRGIVITCLAVAPAYAAASEIAARNLDPTPYIKSAACGASNGDSFVQFCKVVSEVNTPEAFFLGVFLK